MQGRIQDDFLGDVGVCVCGGGGGVSNLIKLPYFTKT